MVSAIEQARKNGDLEPRLFEASRYAAEFYTQKGWTVIPGDRRDIHQIQNGMLDVVCSDERFAYLKGNDPNLFGKVNKVSILGGIFLVAGEVTGGSLTSIQKAQELGRRVGLNLTRHGDEHHGDLGCAMFMLWSTGQINTAYSPNYGTNHIISHADALKVPKFVLPHDHTAEMFTLNFLPGTAAKKTPQNFTHDFWASTLLGIREDAANEIIFELLSHLNDAKRPENRLTTVKIIA